MKRIVLMVTVALVMAAMLAVLAGTAAAHSHVVNNPNHTQELANAQNHPAFAFAPTTGLSTSCEGVNELPNTGPAFYGLETAHHGPDAGTPGKADDGCYAAVGGAPGISPPDTNPAID
jgi:hypothetical protein